MSIKDQLRSRAIQQFGHPRGPLGLVVGRILTTRDTNVARNRWVADTIEPPPRARILEIGHGPGLAIEALWPRLDDGGHITGLEISTLMHRAATRRNRAGIAAGRVDLRLGDSANPPADLTGFDLIYGVNATMFWSDPEAAATELASRLVPGGELRFTFMAPPTSTEPADTVAARTAELFRSVGLVDITHREMDYEPKAIATSGRTTSK